MTQVGTATISLPGEGVPFGRHAPSFRGLEFVSGDEQGQSVVVDAEA
jgi:hypothetical protein